MKQTLPMVVAIWAIFTSLIIHAATGLTVNACLKCTIPVTVNCVSGKMKVLEQTKGLISISQLAKEDVIRGVKGSNQELAWCTVKAIFLVAKGQNRTTYSGFTADHMVVDKTVHRYGNRGKFARGPVYTLSTDCDATENAAGQLFTPISTTFCPHDLSWSEYLSLIGAIRRVTARTGFFWYDLNAYHDNATASVPRWADQLPALCEELLRCARKDDCQKFEVVTEKFVHEHLKANFAHIVDNAFPNLGGNIKKSESGTMSEVVRPKDQSYYTMIICLAVGGFVLVLLILIASLFAYRRSRVQVSKKLPKDSQPPVNASPDQAEA